MKFSTTQFSIVKTDQVRHNNLDLYDESVGTFLGKNLGKLRIGPLESLGRWEDKPR